MEDFNAVEHTEFNSNIATLQRIDSLIRGCVNASTHEDITLWFKMVTNLRKEAIVKMKGEQLKTSTKEYEKLSKRYELYTKYKEDFNIKRTLMKELDAYEIHLREFMNLKGMLLKDMASGMDALK